MQGSHGADSRGYLAAERVVGDVQGVQVGEVRQARRDCERSAGRAVVQRGGEAWAGLAGVIIALISVHARDEKKHKRATTKTSGGTVVHVSRANRAEEAGIINNTSIFFAYLSVCVCVRECWV